MMTESESEERTTFLQMVGKCATELEKIYQMDAALSAEALLEMEDELRPVLLGGFFSMNRKVLSPQEYYQGCMTMLLANLFALVGDRPKDVIASLRSCLDFDGKDASGNMDSDGDSAPLLLNLILDRSQRHPGLELKDWMHVIGLVSTVQSNVAAVNRRANQRRQWLQSNKQQRRILSNRESHSIAKETLEAMWVIPISYIVGFVVYDTTCRDGGETPTVSWEKEIHPKIEKILLSAFPRLRPPHFIDAGLMLLQLDLLQEESGSMPEDLNTRCISSKLQGSLLKLLMQTTDLPKYTLLARCAQAFLSRVDTDSDGQIIDACTKLFRQDNAMEYITNLERKAADGLNAEDVLLLTHGNGSDAEGESECGLRSLSFPLLTNIEALLMDDKVDKAIDIAVKMEHCSLIQEIDQYKAWSLAVNYLFQTGHLFLDGYPLRRPEYMENRQLILEKSMTGAGQIGVQTFLEAYKNLLERLATLPDVTPMENEYIQRACHQTVLRIVQTRYGNSQGVVKFQSEYWKDVEDLVGTSGFQSPPVSSSEKLQNEWSSELLTQPNECPQSMRLDGTLRPDLLQFLRRGEPNSEQEFLTAASASKTPAAVKEAIRAVVLDESSPVAPSPDMDAEMKGTDRDAHAAESPAAMGVQGEVIIDEDEEEEHDEEMVDDSGVKPQQEASDESDDDDVIVLEDTDDDEEEDLANILPRHDGEGGHDSESDETADEGSVQEIFGDGEPGGDEEASSDEEQDHGVADEHRFHDDVEAGEEEQQAHAVIDIMDDGDEEEALEHHGEHSHSEMIETTASQSMDEAGSQTGYEPEDTHGYTEEEVSEAIHTEDEEEERQEVTKVIQPATENEEDQQELPADPPVQLEPHTLSDMDAADEHTTEHEEDPGAESSELDEGDGTDAVPQYQETRPRTDQAGEGSTLMDFAFRAQQADSRRSTPTNDTNPGPPSSAQRPWLWTGASASKPNPPVDGAPSQDAPEAVDSTPKQDLAASQHDAQHDSEAKRGDFQLETPHERSVMGASFADTSAAQFGSVSFVDSPNYAPTDEEENGTSPTKVVVDCVPAVFEDSPIKSTKSDPEEADMDAENEESKAATEVVDESPTKSTKSNQEADEEPMEEENDVQVEVAQDSPTKSTKSNQEADEEPMEEENDVQVEVAQDSPTKSTKSNLEAEEVPTVEAQEVVDVDMQENEEKAVDIIEVDVEMDEDAEEDTGESAEPDGAEAKFDGENSINTQPEKETLEEPEAATEDVADSEDEAESPTKQESIDVEEDAEGETESPNKQESIEEDEADGDVDDAADTNDVSTNEARESANEPPERPSTPPTRRTSRSAAPNSASTMGGKSISVNYGVMSPAMSSVAASEAGNSVLSPQNGPPFPPTEEAVEEAPKTARRSNRRKTAAAPEPEAKPSPTKEAEEENSNAEAEPEPVEAEDKNDSKMVDENADEEEDSGDDEREDDTLPSTVQPQKGRKRSDSVSDIEEEDAEEENGVVTKTTSGRKTRASREAEKTEQESTTGSRSTRRSARGSKPEEPEAEDDAEDQSTAGSRRSTRQHKTKAPTAASETPRRSRRSAKAKETEDVVAKEDDSDDDDNESAADSRRSTRQRKTKPPAAASETPRRRRRGTKKAEEEAKDGDSGDDESTVASKSSRRSTRQTKAKAEEADDQSVASSTRRSTRRRGRSASISDAEEPKGTKRSEPEADPESENDDDADDAGSTRSKGNTRSKRQKTQKADDDLAPIPEEETLGSPALKAPPPKRKTRAKRGKPDENTDDEESVAESKDDSKKETPSRSTRRTTRGKRAKTEETADDEQSVANSAKTGKEAKATPASATKRSTRGRRKASATASDDEESQSVAASAVEEEAKPKRRASKRTAMEDEESTTKAARKAPARGRRGKAATAKADHESEAEEEEDEKPKAKPARKTRATRGKKAAKEEESAAESASEEEEEEEKPKKPAAKKRATRAKKGKAAASDTESVASSVRRSSRRRK